jgi:hypothetical protein
MSPRAARILCKSGILGAKELLLPILYIETSGLSTESPDEAVALIARTQYADWRKIRLLEPRSREYRMAVNALAQRLLDTARHVAEIQLKRELDSDPEDNGTDGVADIVTQVEALLPDWMEAVIVQKSVSAQIIAIWRQYQEHMEKLRRRKAQPSALLSTQIRMVQEMLPLAERSEEDSRVYLPRRLMSEVNDNGYHSGNHGHDTDPETAHTKPAVFDGHFYFLTLPRRLVIQRNAACWPGAAYWLHFPLRELEPCPEFLPAMPGHAGAAEQ